MSTPSTSLLVLNQIRDRAPGAGAVRYGMDFGNLAEIRAGDLVASCTVVASPSSLTVMPGTTVIADGFLVSAVFTGGDANTEYKVTFTPTLVSGQTLPPRTGTLFCEEVG